HKTTLTGYPLRDACFSTTVNIVTLANIQINRITKPILFVTGGGNGAQLLNQLILKHKEQLEERYFIVHQVGKRFMNEFLPLKNDNYLPIDFIGEGMIDLYKLSRIIISRAGAGTVCELMALGKKSLFVPLKIAQRNEQWHNAKEAERKIGSMVVTEDELLSFPLLTKLKELEEVQRQNQNHPPFFKDSKEKIVKEIQSCF
ncbi:MAG: glycosyltransferase, partial [Pseudomonadota bacterium]